MSARRRGLVRPTLLALALGGFALPVSAPRAFGFIWSWAPLEISGKVKRFDENVNGASLEIETRDGATIAIAGMPRPDDDGRALLRPGATAFKRHGSLQIEIDGRAPWVALVANDERIAVIALAWALVAGVAETAILAFAFLLPPRTGGRTGGGPFTSDAPSPTLPR